MKVGAFELKEPVPDLKEPHVISMLRPWVDVGSVGSVTLTRLERHFGARELGRLARPGAFFDFTRYRPTVYQVEGHRTFTVPNTIINYKQGNEGPDLLFLHMLEPHANGEDYTDSILELFELLNVKRYCRVGGMYDAVPHTRPLLITGSLSGKPIDTKAGEARSPGNTYQGPTTILNLVSEGLEKLGIENMTLMAHLPQYVQLEEDYAGVARLLEVLRGFYEFPEELLEAQRGQQQYQEVSADVERNPAAKALVARLEAYYDSRRVATTDESPLSSQVESFLRELEHRDNQ